MKKSFIAIITFCLCALISKAQTPSQKEVYFQSFMSNSKVQTLSNSSVLPSGIKQLIDYKKFRVRFIDGNTSMPNGYIDIFDQNQKQLGTIHFGRVGDTSLTTNHDEWLVSWRDYSNVDITTLQGSAYFYDLNKGGLLFAEIQMNGSNNINWIDSNANQRNAANYCDKTYGNGNGDLSFGECYSCMKGSCGGAGGCEFMCDMIPACNGTIAAACVYLSWQY